ncbi:pre-peptidase C-terminal domain-containing protein [Archangium lipolyticum]|uniref:pre-peptidase C-terminal domain-containing protein n=1 Tax=Archangium lipolyticum TaxID=2970465 RepID=UPI00214B3134|nr:pre-peptidase C-terminal domain-containing protein [Archangium lipolyticum]
MHNPLVPPHAPPNIRQPMTCRSRKEATAARHIMNLLARVMVVLILASASLAHAQTTMMNSGWTKSAGQSQNGANPKFKFTLPSTQTVTIDLMSSVDTYLYLLNSNSVVLYRDDDSGDGFNSRLTVTLSAGTYYIVAATYSTDQSGRFTLSTTGGSLGWCFVGYEHANYGGIAYQFCSGGPFPSHSSWNDKISSFRVPKGMMVRAFEHADGSGVARTYYADVPYVGPLYNDITSALSWDSFAENGFAMAMVSDPQFAWTYCKDSSSSTKCSDERNAYPNWSAESLSRLYNGRMRDTINNVKNVLGDAAFGGVIVNGDLTEFGDQDADLGDYVANYEHGLKANVYLGLGNHDYANNVDDCSFNHCANSMVSYHKAQVGTLNPVSFDYGENGGDHAGSLGYSWEIGDVHFVQLNNYPTYTRSWSGFNFSEWRTDYFYITSAIAWLRTDLQNAAARGKKIILNWHDWAQVQDNAEVLAILRDFPVIAVFAGHRHELFGLTGFSGDGTNVPIFHSGSAHYGTFLVTRFFDNKMYVWMMEINQLGDGSLRIVHPNTDERIPVSNLTDKFDVCTGCTQYYKYVIDMNAR